MVIPHEAGSRTINIKFQKFDDLPPENFFKVEKTVSAGLADLPETETPNMKTGILKMDLGRNSKCL